MKARIEVKTVSYGYLELEVEDEKGFDPWDEVEKIEDWYDQVEWEEYNTQLGVFRPILKCVDWK